MQTVVISVDAELGWGFHDWPSPPEARVECARTGWKRLLDLLAEYRIPATWAVVGHLFLDDCDGQHAEHPTPPGWFAVERNEWRDRPEVRFGGDLVEDLLSSTVPHEVACHTFSHVIFDETRTSRELAWAELEASVKAARGWDLSFDSFVFPRNRIGYRDLLAEAGFRCYRGRAPRSVPREGINRSLAKLARATVLDPEPVIVRPTVDEYGLVNIPPSLFLYSVDGLPRRVIEPLWGNPVVREARRGVDEVIDEGGVFHLWLHPNNLYGEAQINQLRAVLEYIAERAEATDLSVETMASITETFRRDSATGVNDESPLDVASGTGV